MLSYKTPNPSMFVIMEKVQNWNIIYFMEKWQRWIIATALKVVESE